VPARTHATLGEGRIAEGPDGAGDPAGPVG
jgi:hypothetical protein